jgi:hypothetical protein
MNFIGYVVVYAFEQRRKRNDIINLFFNHNLMKVFLFWVANELIE